MSDTTHSLAQARVLVVEDEPFIALDLVSAIEDAHGVPVGPAMTVKEALDSIASNRVNAAVVDVDLPDGHIGPVLEALDGKACVVVHTGVGLPPSVASRFAHIRVFMKPTPASQLAAYLARELSIHR